MDARSKSETAGIVLVTALALVSCSRPAPPPRPVAESPSEATMTWDNKPRDPCAEQYFDETLCQSAIQNRGYHYGGLWIPIFYTRAYSSYFNDHTTFMSSGGHYAPTPARVYDPGFKAPTVGTLVQGPVGKTAAESALKGLTAPHPGPAHSQNSPPRSSSAHHKRPSPSAKPR